MPYSPEHKAETRDRILRAARDLFNRRGFADVSIDQIMAAADLTRGGFYNHFGSKEELFLHTVMDFAAAREAEIDDDVDTAHARHVFASYVSTDHLDGVGGQCPLMALPSDVAHSSPAVRHAYARTLNVLARIFGAGYPIDLDCDDQTKGHALAALAVGSMVLARTVDDRRLAESIIASAHRFAGALPSNGTASAPTAE